MDGVMSVARLHAIVGAADVVPTEDEKDLVARAQNDREAFAVLYRRHYSTLAAHVFRRTGDVHVTEDLVSDVFVTTLRTLRRYRYRGVPLRFWLLRIATNAVNRWARRQRRRAASIVQAGQLEDAKATQASTHGEVDRERARRALLSLSPKYQAVLALHYFEGLAIKEIAAVIGCRVGTVKSRLARAREALRDELNRWR